MLLLANGDSFPFGDGLLPPGDSGPWHSLEHRHYAIKHGWPSILADRFGWDLCNLSISLGSNDRMVRTTMDHICRHGANGIMVVLSWSEIMRRELHCIDHPFPDGIYENGSRWMKLGATSDTMWNVPGGEEWQKRNLRFGWDVVESLTRFSQQVLLLSSWLRSLGIPYLHLTSTAKPMFDYDSLLSESYGREEVGPLFESIDWSDWMTYQGSVNDVCVRFCIDMDKRLPCGHPTLEGHSMIADIVALELQRRFSVNPVR